MSLSRFVPFILAVIALLAVCFFNAASAADLGEPLGALFFVSSLNAPWGLKSSGTTVRGGVIDAFSLRIVDVTNADPAALQTDIQAALASVKIKSEYVGSSGNSEPFIGGGVTAADFRQLNNLTDGYLAPSDGCMIPTGRRHMASAEGFNIELEWDGFAPANGSDFSAAKLKLDRIERAQIAPESMHPVYFRRVVDGVTVSAQVPNLARILYFGNALESGYITVNGREYELPADLVRAVTAVQYRHEDESSSPPIVLYDADRYHAALTQPSIRIETTEGASEKGYLIQIGSRPDAAAIQRAAARNSRLGA